jgi:hypothetical protein
MSDVGDPLGNVSIGPASYAESGEKYDAALLEQYRLCAETAERVRARRNLTDTFLLTHNSVVVALLGGLLSELRGAVSVWLLLPGFLILLSSCGAWYVMVLSRRQLNSAKRGHREDGGAAARLRVLAGRVAGVGPRLRSPTAAVSRGSNRGINGPGVRCMSVSGFWSYSRQADAADRGRIVELARLVADEYRNLTGTRLDLYLDVDGTRLGVDLRQTINANLRRSTFFIAVVSPLYYKSPECQRELRYFLRKANELGRTELLIPIRYIASRYPDHPMTPVLDRYLWEDWTKLRLDAPDSAAHRRAVHAVASRLAELSPPPAAPEPATPEPSVLPADLNAAFKRFTDGYQEFVERMRTGDSHAGVSGLLDCATAFADDVWKIDDAAAALVPVDGELLADADKARSALEALVRPVTALRADEDLPERTRLLCVLLEAALVDARTTIEGWTLGRYR